MIEIYRNGLGTFNFQVTIYLACQQGFCSGIATTGGAGFPSRGEARAAARKARRAYLAQLSERGAIQ